MSRAFWMAVGAVGGIVAYRKGVEAAARARELGPLGTAQVAAAATGRLATRTAHGLGRLNDLKARREGRLVIGSAEEVPSEGAVPARTEASSESAASGTRRPPSGRSRPQAPPRPATLAQLLEEDEPSTPATSTAGGEARRE
jgi:hypothetical protein